MIKISRFTNILTQKIKYCYLPVSCYEISTKPNPVVCVTLGTNQGAYCDLHFRLFENVVPKTAENYKRLLLGTGKYQNRNLSLIGTGITKHVQRAYLKLGFIPEGNCSIFGPKFRDQSFELLHDRPGLLTSISEENTNNSRFAITLAPCPFMDLKNIVFGQITPDTFNNLRELERLGPKILGLKILSTQLLKIPEHHDDHHHHEQHHDHEEDAHPGHHGLKHKHDHH